MHCRGGYCEMCPVKIQLECEGQMATPIARIEHIRQCLRRMRPTMGYELAGALEIEQELAVLEDILRRLMAMVEPPAPQPAPAVVACPNCRRRYETTGCNECPFCAHEWDDTLTEMTRAALNGDTCG